MRSFPVGFDISQSVLSKHIRKCEFPCVCTKTPSGNFITQKEFSVSSSVYSNISHKKKWSIKTTPQYSIKNKFLSYKLRKSLNLYPTHTQRHQESLGSAFVAGLYGKASGALGRDLMSSKQYSCVECFNNDVDYRWLSAYRYHEINHLSKVCFLSSLFTFPHFILAIFVYLYFHRVVS
jgi:hypothetical protein